MEDGFKSLMVWQKSYALVLEVYRNTRSFPQEERYGIVSQLRRAAVSILLNIAEGYERSGKKEFLYFLNISKGSLGEVETILKITLDLTYLNNESYMKLENLRKETARLLVGLIKSLYKA